MLSASLDLGERFLPDPTSLVAAAVSATGTDGVEHLIGSAFNDTLDGAGGGDSLLAGAGNDLLIVGDGTFTIVDGGTGQDTLSIGTDLDLTTIGNDAVTGIETIDLTGAANVTLTIGIDDVLAFSGNSNSALAGAPDDDNLVIAAGAGDAIDLTANGQDGSWVSAGSTIIGGETYGLYDFQDAASGLIVASVAIDDDARLL